MTENRKRLSCTLAPASIQTLKKQAGKTGQSQGMIIDYALSQMCMGRDIALEKVIVAVLEYGANK